MRVALLPRGKGGLALPNAPLDKAVKTLTYES
jgi:hypothetical protein